MQHLSPTAQSIVAHLRAGLAALDDLKSQPERDLIYQVLASHVRSAAPMALTGAADLVEPLGAATIPLTNGHVELTAIDGAASMYVADATGHDVAVTVNAAQAQELRVQLARVR